MCMHAQSCLTLCDTMDCSLSGSSVDGISQARILEWVANSFSGRIFPTQGSNLCLLHLLHWQADWCRCPTNICQMNERIKKNFVTYLGIKRQFLNFWFCLGVTWRRKWQPTPVFLPGEPHGQRNLVVYSPWGRKESDTTERLSTAHNAGWYRGPPEPSNQSKNPRAPPLSPDP